MFDPRLRIVDTAFHVRVSAAQKKKAIGTDDAAEAAWFKIDDLPKMGFHHEREGNVRFSPRNIQIFRYG